MVFKTTEIGRNQKRTNLAAIRHHQKVNTRDIFNSLLKKRTTVFV